jgi:hypothetical protein
MARFDQAARHRITHIAQTNGSDIHDFFRSFVPLYGWSHAVRINAISYTLYWYQQREREDNGGLSGLTHLPAIASSECRSRTQVIGDWFTTTFTLAFGASAV